MIDDIPAITVPPRARIPLIGAAWQALLGWLRNVPIADPVDRRNAPMLQLVSLLLAILPSLAWFYRIWRTDIAWRPGELSSMALSLSVCAAAALCFVLIRYGRFMWASRLLLVVFAITVIPAYFATGFGAQRFEQPILVLWMAIAGLVIGRGALWIMFCCVMAAFAVGAYVDVDAGQAANSLIGDGLFSAAMFLMVAVVLDRSSAALRESLREANERGDALARANASLKEEISEREKAQEQLIHAQKLEAVGRLASGVAHDFGNLLSLILGYTTRARRLQEPEELRQALAGVESAARRAVLVVRKLLSFSRQDETLLQVFDPAEALRELQPMLRQLFPPEIDLQLDMPVSLPSIRFDRNQFELMSLNIASNAQQAMQDGGRFVLSATPRAEGGIALEFSDDGVGMASDVQARVFEPFFTTKPSGQGTGLGLSVVRDLVTAAAGSLDVRSAPGIGTTLRIELPAA